MKTKLTILILIFSILTQCSTQVKITSAPSNAKLYINGNSTMGRTPQEWTLSNFILSPYTVRLELEGYKTLETPLKQELKIGTTIAAILFFLPIFWVIGPQAEQHFLLEKISGGDQISSNTITPQPTPSSNVDIHEAAQAGDLNSVKEALKNGSKVDKRDQNQNTPLIIASENGHLDVVNFLIEKKANVNAKNVNDVTALLLSTGNGHLEVVKLLLQRNADVNIKSVRKTTPLYRAIREGHLEIAKLILQM